MKGNNIAINEIVNYGLDLIDSNETITVNTRDLVYIYKAIEEFIRFFHQANHYPTLKDVEEYIGNKDGGAYSILSNIYYNIFSKMFPHELKEMLEGGEFINPQMPYYKK